MKFFKNNFISILLIGLCTTLSITGCSREDTDTGTRIGTSTWNTENFSNSTDLFVDFTSSYDSDVVKHGDFVIRNGVLELYTGRATHVEIPADLEITAIGFAFSHSNVVSIVIPEQVESFTIAARDGFSVFYDCFYLQSITVAEGNKNFASVDGVLFNKNMTEIIHFPLAKAGSYTVPDGITTIGNFNGRSELTSITIPASVSRINEYAFDFCRKLESINIDQNNRNYASVDGVLYNKAIQTLLWVPHGYRGSYTMPNTVTGISRGAINYRTGLSEVTISNRITRIESNTFYGCTNLVSVTIPNSVTRIDVNAFYNCTNLISINIPASVRTLDENIFGNCTSLASITVDQDNTSFASVEGVLFNKAVTELIYFPLAKSGSYNIPSTVIGIRDFAFSSRTGLTSIRISASVRVIGQNAFFDCTRLTSITVDENNANYSSADGVLFNKAKTELIRYPRAKTGRYIIPNTVLIIAENAFAGASSLTAVTIPNSVTIIGRTAFAETGLRSLNIPNSVTVIERGAFVNNPDLTIIGLPDGYRIEQQGDGYAKGDDYFYYGFTGLQRFIVSRNNQHYSTVDGVLFNKDRTELIRFPPGKTGSYTIPNTVTTIAYKAFYGASLLTSINIPASVTTIGDFAFDGCTSLASVNIPNSVTDIGRYAFVRCTNLNSVSIPASVVSIGNFAFYDTRLRQISIDYNNQNYTLANGMLLRKDLIEQNREHSRYWIAALVE
ncbi:MAG: leucine-rich repeat domain-containing protein [Treponema sp.]|nr:leucine-rich repeat domain-containing protein [Treponema sp.]